MQKWKRDFKNRPNKLLGSINSFYFFFEHTEFLIDEVKSRAATNNYFDNRLVGWLFFRLIEKKNIYIFLFYWQKTHCYCNLLGK